MVTDHLVICGQLENCTLTFVCPLALKDKLGGLHHVSENCVRNGFIKARGDEAVSCDSDYVHDDTFSEMEEEGMEEIPKEILNVIDSFNVESDEEILGFE